MIRWHRVGGAIVEDTQGRRVLWGGFASKRGASQRLTHEEHEAVLRLVEAAPDLLAALQHLMRYDFGESQGAKEARAAIAKATGAP